MKRYDIGENVVYLALIALFAYAAWLGDRNSLKTPKESQIEVVYEPQYHTTIAMLDEYGKEEPTQDVVLYVMSELGIEHKHIVYAQMVLESGHFDSKLAKENNNYFGMKEPCRRSTVSLGKKNGYASYRNWAWSVLDYALWQIDVAKGLTEEEYLELLGRVYAEDERYVEKIKSISNNLI